MRIFFYLSPKSNKGKDAESEMRRLRLHTAEVDYRIKVSGRDVDMVNNTLSTRANFVATTNFSKDGTKVPPCPYSHKKNKPEEFG